MQRTTFVFKSPNSTRDLNYHIANLLAPGVYHGMDLIASTPPSMSADLNAGYALTDEGVKIEETLATAPLCTFAASDPNFPRIDLVVLRHRYNPELNPNAATYAIIKGTPTPPPNQPVGNYAVVSDPLCLEYPASVHPGDIILCEVLIPAGCTAITNDLIFNKLRTLTTPELQAQMAEALYISLGNFVYEGWEFVSDVLNISVTPGRGLLCGLPNKTTCDTLLTQLRVREFLYGPEDPDTHVLYQVGPNLTLNKQPDYPSKLRITITATDVPTDGMIYISGRDEFGEEINNETIYVSCPAGDTVTVTSIHRFQEVYHEGIDAHQLVRPGHNIYISIKDKPIGYIYAIGTDSGRALFKIIYDPSYRPLCNEYLLGWAETDETHIIELVRWAVTALANVIEDLSVQCDGTRRIFVTLGIPWQDSQILVMDGLTLMPGNAVKGYTIDENVITLGSDIPTPDNPTHGQSPCNLWIMYKRQA